MESVSLSSREAVEVVDGVYVARLAAGEHMSVRHFHVEPGATLPEHRLEAEQVGFVYRGAATFLVDGETIVIGPGESYWVPAGEPRSVENRGEDAVVGLDVFSPPWPTLPWVGRTDPSE